MMKNGTKFYLGIDSGGTKCDIISIDQQERIVAENSYPALHYNQHGLLKTARKLFLNIDNFINNKKLDKSLIQGICVGITGVRLKKDRTQIQKLLNKFFNFNKIKIETDTNIAFYGYFGVRDGLILISGTGSILFGKVNKKIYRIGGWGKLLGDYGSGYNIGLEALKEIVKEYDNKNAESQLSKSLKKEFGFNPDNIIRKIYHEKFPLQNIAPVVFKCAEKGDKISKEIIKVSVNNLCEHIIQFNKRSNLKKQIELALVGGLINNENIFSRNLITQITKNFDNIKIIKKFAPPVYGAALLAKKTFDKL